VKYHSTLFMLPIMVLFMAWLILITPTHAMAETPTTLETSEALKVDCTAPHLSSIETQYCTHLASQGADERLNKNYQQLIQHIKRRDHRKLLHQAQKAWVQFRNNECNLRAAPHNIGAGTGFNTALNRCITDITNKRITELQRLMKSSLTYPNSR